MDDTSIRDPTVTDGTSAGDTTAELMTELLQNQHSIISNQETLIGLENDLLVKIDTFTEAVLWMFFILLFSLIFKVLFGTFSNIFNNA